MHEGRAARRKVGSVEGWVHWLVYYSLVEEVVFCEEDFVLRRRRLWRGAHGGGGRHGERGKNFLYSYDHCMAEKGEGALEKPRGEECRGGK